jgi:hypothetical protein
VSEKSINAAQNPALANKLIQEASKTTEKPVEVAVVVSPSETVVTLPGGFLSNSGEVITVVEVRELTGRDEEAIAKSNNIGRVLTTILSRGTVSIGEEPATEEMLDRMFAGDRDAVLLGIYRATFGDDVDLDTYCSGCTDYKTIQINVQDDVEVKRLEDVVSQRLFTVNGKKNTYLCTLPTGKVQKELLINSDKTVAELTTTLLEGTVREINGRTVLSRSQVQEIGIVDRRLIGDALMIRTFGPVLDEVKATCPDCGGEVVAPINLGALFRQ